MQKFIIIHSPSSIISLKQSHLANKTEQKHKLQENGTMKLTKNQQGLVASLLNVRINNQWLPWKM